GITLWGAEGVSAGANYGTMKSEGTMYNNTQIQAGNKLKIKADNMEIRGGRAVGKHVEADIKENLLIESLQDKEEMKQMGVSVGYSMQKGKGKDGKPDNRHNGSLGGNYGRKDKEWVSEQSGIIGTESANVKVGGELTLIGGIIANIDEEGKDKGNLTLSYGSLRTADIKSHDKLINLNGNIEINQRSRDNNTKMILDKNGKNDNVKEVPNRVDETYGVGVEGHEREKITRAEEMLKDVNVQKTEFIFKSEPNSWGDFNKIMSSNAGIIGNFLDDMNEHTGNKVRTNYEDKFRTRTNEIISKVERPLDKINRFISILPTSGTHGGILEQIVRTVRYDKTPIVKIGIEKNKEDGTVMVGMEEIRKISDYKSKDGSPVKVNTNGIIELKENAVRNTIFKNMTKEDMDRYNRGERVEMLMVYNPTRGAVADIIESALGKMFDGSWSSLGLSIGVNRGAAVAYASRDKNQSYDFSFYSQGNIIGLGAFNILKNNGIKLGNGAGNFNVRMYGTPIAIKSYQNFEGVLGINVLGAAVNEPDFVGSNGKWAGLIG
ncbi:hemagglutinin repeat-containing protein, partial [Pseudoleptotrichia goodfellowii]